MPIHPHRHPKPLFARHLAHQRKRVGRITSNPRPIPNLLALFAPRVAAEEPRRRVLEICCDLLVYRRIVRDAHFSRLGDAPAAAVDDVPFAAETGRAGHEVVAAAEVVDAGAAAQGWVPANVVSWTDCGYLAPAWG